MENRDNQIDTQKQRERDRIRWTDKEVAKEVVFFNLCNSFLMSVFCYSLLSSLSLWHQPQLRLDSFNQVTPTSPMFCAGTRGLIDFYPNPNLGFDLSTGFSPSNNCPNPPLLTLTKRTWGLFSRVSFKVVEQELKEGAAHVTRCMEEWSTVDCIRLASTIMVTLNCHCGPKGFLLSFCRDVIINSCNCLVL